MVLVDTSVWIEIFRKGTRFRLESAVGTDEPIIKNRADKAAEGEWVGIQNLDNIPSDQAGQGMPPFMDQKQPKAKGEKHAEEEQKGPQGCPKGFDFVSKWLSVHY